MNSKQEKLNGVFDQLQETGKCRTKKDFAAMLGVSYTGLTRAMNGDEQYLTNSLIAKAVGLLAVPEPVPQEDGSAPDRVPLIPYEARGGLIGDFVDGVHGYDCEMVISPIKGVDFAMTVTGDSMMPEYNPGDRILIKRIDPNLFIEWGRVYVLDTPNGAVLKKLEKAEDPGFVQCLSINPGVSPFQIDMKTVRGWYRVLMVMSMK